MKTENKNKQNRNSIKIFTPVESVNPLYLGASDESLYARVIQEHSGNTFAEIKEDGYRMQVHKKGEKIMAFTRSMNPIMLELFPELAQSLGKLPDCIIDSELIGDGRVGHQGFDLVKRRFRHRISEKGAQEYLKSGIVQDLPLALRVFDVLFWENQELINLPLQTRRNYTESIDERKIKPSVKTKVSSAEELKKLFTSLTSENYEGLVCKNPNSIYVPGARDKNWVKLKRSESLDLCVLGVYLEGTQISQILCGTYNPEKKVYETLAKVNAKREGMNKELEKLLKDSYLETCPANISLNPAISKTKDAMPHYFIAPEKTTLVEVAAMNFFRGKNWQSCGYDGTNSYSMRIGWLKGIRDDKKISDISSVSLVKTLYDNERTS